MNRLRIYRFLMGTLGIALLVFGVGMVVSFFLYQRPNSVPGIPTGPVGHYFVAFTGCALLGWSGGLLGAARDPMGSRTVGTMTVFVLGLMALIRMVAWVIGDYTAWLGDLPLTEANFFLLLALALVWLRPTVAETMAGRAGEAVVADQGSEKTSETGGAA